ncbi:terminase large subunit domain-containing protein [Jiangella muralis]|uniref:terminase large subunit domain-containing protein n=1 Tax=Jiangella muralis TaxID=702383 RepID=UPI00069ECBA4|nr:terminase family protein [Jiangella muralis]
MTEGGAAEPPRWRYPYTPTEAQQRAHDCGVDEMLYGGAAGGGKSEMLLATAVHFALLVPGSASVIFRRTFPDLDRSLIPRLLKYLPSSVATWHATAHRWTFRNGSTIELAHLSRENDVLKYQGAEYQFIAFDELTQFTESQYRYLLSRLRAGGDVRDRMAALGLRPRVMSAANPGGPGHHWVKARWIDPASPGQVWRPVATLEDPQPGTRAFIPARVTDNPHIDGSYVNRLNGLDEMLRRALRDGDWDVLEGARFSRWRRDIHVIEPHELPITFGGTVRAIGVDYGLDAPFAALWGARLGDGLVVVYRELYEAGLTPRKQAAAIADAETADERARPVPLALDPSTWARNPHAAGKAVAPVVDPDAPPIGSIAHSYTSKFGTHVVKARNDRRAGVALVDDKLIVRPDGLPRLLVYSTCVNLIRTLPALGRSTRDPEDVDTKAEDHAYDALRYLLMELEGAGPHRSTAPPPGRELVGAHTGDVAAAAADLTTAGF